MTELEKTMERIRLADELTEKIMIGKVKLHPNDKHNHFLYKQTLIDVKAFQQEKAHKDDITRIKRPSRFVEIGRF